MKYILLVLSFFLYACDQDPMFWMISNEVEPRDPIIAGSPSKMVRFEGDIYVANGRLWKYSGGSWGRAGGPSNVYDLAVAGSSLYMLQVSNSDTSVYKLNGNKIRNPTGYGMIQGLYSDDTSLFAGAMNSGDGYAILKLTDEDRFTVERSIGSPLAGVTEDYFATAMDGILYRNPAYGTVSNSSGRSIAGIIKVNGITIAVTGGGDILEVSGGGVTVHEPDVWSFTGALAVYTRPDFPDKPILLLGARSGVYEMGYREMRLYEGIDFSLHSPGGLAPFSTVLNRERYSATLAKSAVNSLMQVSGEPVVFASTQKDGLWACRGNEWNAEE
jgi:hypothetical protein